MRGVGITLAVGFTAMALAVGLSLLRSPATLTRTNGVADDTQTAVAATSESAVYCQPNEELPAHTSAIRISLVASIGPRTRLYVLSAGHVLTSGEQGAGWTGSALAVPVRQLARAVPAATVCVAFRLRDGMLFLLGEDTPPDRAAREGRFALPGRMRVEFVSPGTRTWASMIPAIVRSIGLSHDGDGGLIVLVVLTLLALLVGLTTRLLLTDLP
ncbi:MAG TPA: hypothetical protein VMD79_13205 [Solirubrobacteraceae bacterium]|nr:hypothetical protein [Solirubrobacteraceae bacterium]